MVATVPPLRGRRAADGAEEKAGHSGRDDKLRDSKRKSRGNQEEIKRKSRGDQEKSREPVALGRKNPPFAKSAKDGAPSRSFKGDISWPRKSTGKSACATRVELFTGV